MATYFGLISTTYTDWLGQSQAVHINISFPDTLTIAQVVTAVLDYALIEDPLTDAVLTGLEFKMIVPISGVKTATSANTNLEAGGLITFTQVSSPYKESEQILAFAQAQISHGKIIEGTGTPLQEYINEVTNTGGTFRYVTHARNGILAFLRSKLNTRKYRKGETKLTSES